MANFIYKSIVSVGAVVEVGQKSWDSLGIGWGYVEELGQSCGGDAKLSLGALSLYWMEQSYTGSRFRWSWPESHHLAQVDAVCMLCWGVVLALAPELWCRLGERLAGVSLLMKWTRKHTGLASPAS